MSWGATFDVVGALFLLVGAFLCLAAAVGLLRFPDVLTRMHAATKPQTLGLLLVATGVAISLREPRALGLLVLVAVLQLLTAPVSAHMVGRTAYRTGRLRGDITQPDDLGADLARAGFRRTEDGDGDHHGDRDGPGADSDDDSGAGGDDDTGDDGSGGGSGQSRA